MELEEFKELVWDKGRELFREMPWRQDTRPYYVLVSEIMLQQTQVERVKTKFAEFTTAFADIDALANAGLDEVLRLWSGLGYNRRAKFLHSAAKMIRDEYNGVFPDTLEGLLSLPGVGANTAGAILAYSFNKPSVFIETNIRTVYFYHLFEHQEQVSDKELRITVEETVDLEHPREWYWALMDYGSYLKRNGAGQNNKSKQYKKQSPLKGSIREVRGQILKALTSESIPVTQLKEQLTADERFTPALDGLLRDSLVTETDGILHLTR